MKGKMATHPRRDTAGAEERSHISCTEQGHLAFIAMAPARGSFRVTFPSASLLRLVPGSSLLVGIHTHTLGKGAG